ncbi:energy transducer TonB [Neolewinella aurantiaca]|nr:energy transducer TonB [Neolewinella aurantiaca]
MPYPAVCDSIVPTDQYNCSNELIRHIIYKNLRWPGPDVCVEGMAVISFLVCESGELENFKVVRDPGAGTGEEALRLVKLMAQQTSPWVPGTRGQERKPVEMQYHVPVKFRLE